MESASASTPLTSPKSDAESSALHAAPEKARHMRGIAHSLHEAHEKGEHEDHGPCFACRRFIGQVLEAHMFELLVVALVLLELCMTVFETGIDNKWFCVGASPMGGEDATYVCESAEGPNAKSYLEFCEHAGFYILLFFTTELLLKISVSPTEFFCHNPWHILDFTCVLVSCIIAFIIKPHLEAAGKDDWPKLILVCRLWRLVKIFRSVDEELAFLDARAAEETKEQNELLRSLCKKHNVPIPAELEKLLGEEQKEEA